MFDILDQSSGHMCSGLVVTGFFVSLPCTHVCPSGGSLLSDSNLVTPIQGSDSDVSPSILTVIIDGCLMKYINVRFRLSLDMCNSEVSENRLLEPRVLFYEQHVSNLGNF